MLYVDCVLVNTVVNFIQHFEDEVLRCCYAHCLLLLSCLISISFIFNSGINT